MARTRRRALARFGRAVERGDFELLIADVADPQLPDVGASIVFHGASPAQPAAHASSPTTTLKSNVLGTLNLLDQVAHTEGSSFVLLSSSEVYGAVEGRDMIAEDTFGGLNPFAGRAAYSEGKRLAETSLACYRDEFGVAPLSARFGHIYGPGIRLDDGRVQADFLADAVHGRDIVMNSSGSATRTYTYVADAVAGLLWAHLRGQEQVYNVADPGGLVSIRSLAETFAAHANGGPKELAFASAEDGRSYSPMTSLGLDATKLLDLGWRPRTDLGTGVERTIRSFDGGADTDA
jgi:nucleoside-diphosphate-sugar epimerase